MAPTLVGVPGGAEQDIQRVTVRAAARPERLPFVRRDRGSLGVLCSPGRGLAAGSRQQSRAPGGDCDARCRRDGPDHHSLGRSRGARGVGLGGEAVEAVKAVRGPAAASARQPSTMGGATTKGVRGQRVQELAQQLPAGPGGLHLAGRVVATEQVGQPSPLLLGQVLGGAAQQPPAGSAVVTRDRQAPVRPQP